MANRTLSMFLPYVAIVSLQYIFAKDSLLYGSPYVFMSMRYLIVAAIIIAIGRRISITRDTLAIAAAFSASSLFWILGLEYVSPGDSAVLSYTMPLFAIPVAIIIARERPGRWEIAGSSVGFLGVAVYSLTLSHGSLLLGTLLSLGGALFWAVFSVYYRKLRGQDRLSILATQFLFGSIPFLIGSIFEPVVQFTPWFFVDLAYMAILGGAVQLFLWSGLLSHLRIGKATTMAFAVPAVTIVIQSIQEVQIPALLSIGGAVIMFVGIVLANRDKTVQERPTTTEVASGRAQDVGSANRESGDRNDHELQSRSELDLNVNPEQRTVVPHAHRVGGAEPQEP